MPQPILQRKHYLRGVYYKKLIKLRWAILIEYIETLAKVGYFINIARVTLKIWNKNMFQVCTAPNLILWNSISLVTYSATGNHPLYKILSNIQDISAQIKRPNFYFALLIYQNNQIKVMTLPIWFVFFFFHSRHEG